MNVSSFRGRANEGRFCIFFLSYLSSTQEPSLTLQLFKYYLHNNFISTLYFFIYHYLSFDLPILSHHIFFVILLIYFIMYILLF